MHKKKKAMVAMIPRLAKIVKETKVKREKE